MLTLGCDGSEYCDLLKIKASAIRYSELQPSSVESDSSSLPLESAFHAVALIGETSGMNAGRTDNTSEWDANADIFAEHYGMLNFDSMKFRRQFMFAG